ncbi:MAG: hypothetical protein JWN48_4865 [Myxococcaceae bacterium]|nr:hypothetical protein [Myxococcaceae bacterium]
MLPGPNGATFLLEGPGPWQNIELPLRRMPGPSLGVLRIPQLSLRSELELREGERELDVLFRSLGRMLDSSGKVVYAGCRRNSAAAKHRPYKTRRYLTDRDLFFGSRDAYQAYLSASRSELNAAGGLLRKKVEPSIGRRYEPDWQEAQDIFYSWVRKAFEVENGNGASLAAAVRFGMSEKLQAALAQATIDSGESFKYGGYNPRPMKKEGYRLGTLSEHATGNAIDIESTSNAQIKQWGSIESYTGIRLGHRERVSLWASHPEQLHTAIRRMNDTFVSKLREAVRAQQGAGMNGDAALEAVVSADADLRTLGLSWVKHWRAGFFSLSWSLVKELHEEKLTWGATFSTPDLHHFEFQRVTPVSPGEAR